ncbi:MAG: fluoride efflux transporter CrcB [Solirubrobacteraceae bacterium]
MNLSLPTWIAVAVLGGLGAIARFVIDAVISTTVITDFPLGTLVINLSGSLLLGLFSGLALTGDALVLIGTATLGSYTTFSTWMLETHRSAEDGSLTIAFLNVVISLSVGFGAVVLGRTIGAHL